MRIYICIPERLNHELDNIRTDLCTSLEKYYGYIDRGEIEFFAGSSRTIEVYIMEKALNGDDIDIRNKINSLLSKIDFDLMIDVKLNYQRFNPDFRPSSRKLQKNNAPAVSEDVQEKEKDRKLEEFDYEKLSLNYHAEKPHYTFNQVILPKKTLNKILDAAATIQVEEKVFDEWGLRSIIPYAASVVSFYGSPGTGKTMTADAVAHKLGKKIIRASYADIESKYHGEGPKMVKAIFMAAEREDAVLFIDESESLLSKRLTNVNSGSEQAINSMRSQLLMCLEQFRGIVIFATNLVENYDKAFISRLISIEFLPPDKEARRAIWDRHLRGEGLRIPLSDDVNPDELAEKYDTFCGREIRNAVKDACVKTAKENRELVTQDDLIKACEKVKTDKEENERKETKSALKNLLQKKINSSRNNSGVKYFSSRPYVMYRPRRH
ncbi:MAG: ATP-binding protein [Synergistaceae bacterium]|nr:ATP-binding protein [Synergistaceae bacterium]MBQ3449390.1 ATP-binding protein [Synergistaceae bacterium]MBQ3695016.1 ATP-binding protein [Synergistaceae bacterium]MBQ9628836.1 ATP-binding protein [Synergistaceae bacterium]MBR0250015.1 ATP-binding protein [Synergistaceae bacterium]